MFLMEGLAVLLLNALTLVQRILVNGNGRLGTGEKEEKGGKKRRERRTENSVCVCVHL